MTLTREIAEKALEEAIKKNPGPWAEHSRYVALALPTGFCLLEKRFVDVTIRYGTHPSTIERWKVILGIKEHFEKKMGCSIYDCLPGVIENSFQ